MNRPRCGAFAGAIVVVALAGAAACQGADGPREPADGGEAGEYQVGPYHCCAEGQGTSCCAEYEPGTCFQYGGVSGRCARAGEMVEGKDICALCCDGLERVTPMVPTDERYEDYPAGCGPAPVPDSLSLCIACGDGVCSADENVCTCAADCGN